MSTENGIQEHNGISNHWSEPILQRRTVMAMSDTDASSELSITPPPPPKSVKKIRHYNNNYSVKSKKDCEIDENDTVEAIRDNLKLKVSEIQAQEECYNENVVRLEKSLQLTEALFKTLAQFIQVICVQYKTSEKLKDLSTTLFYGDSEEPDAKAIRNQLAMKNESHQVSIQEAYDKLQELYTNCTCAISISDETSRILEEFRIRSYDFATASLNFTHLLNKSTLDLSKKQLVRLDAQFDSILVGNQLPRKLLEIELPNLIAARKKQLAQYFEELQEWYRKLLQNDTANSVLKLSLVICEKLKKELNIPGAGDAKISSCHGKSSSQGIQQKRNIFCANCTVKPNS